MHTYKIIQLRAIGKMSARKLTRTLLFGSKCDVELPTLRSPIILHLDHSHYIPLCTVLGVSLGNINTVKAILELLSIIFIKSFSTYWPNANETRSQAPKQATVGYFQSQFGIDNTYHTICYFVASGKVNT